MRLHILPQCLAPYLVLATMCLGVTISIEATLGFLEIGIPPPTPTWGNMLADSLTLLEAHWWLVCFPGLAIRLTGLAFNLLRDGIHDILDSRLRVALGRVGEELTKRCRVLPTPSMQRGERTGLQRYSGARSANISRSPCKRP